MLCPKCGTQNEDNVLTCCQCGEEIIPSVPAESEPPIAEEQIPAAITDTETDVPAPKKSKKKLWIGLGAGVAALGALAVAFVVCVIAVIILIVSLNAPKRVANEYMEAVTGPDTGVFLDIIHDDILDEDFDSKQDQIEWSEKMDSSMESLMNTYARFNGNIEIDYDISNVEKVSDRELEAIQEAFEEYDCKVKKAKEVTFDVTISNKYGESTQEVTVYVVKIGTKWYIDIFNTTSPYYTLFLILEKGLA